MMIKCESDEQLKEEDSFSVDDIGSRHMVIFPATDLVKIHNMLTTYVSRLWYHRLIWVLYM